jgi:hypothetical protein
MTTAKKQPKGQENARQEARGQEARGQEARGSEVRGPKARTVREREKKIYSWAMIMESRHAKPPEKEPVISSSDRGRPRLNVATTQTSMTLSKGDRDAIEFWQEQLSLVLHRKASMGETVGFLARACQERLALVGEPGSAFHSLQDLVQALVGEGLDDEEK